MNGENRNTNGRCCADAGFVYSLLLMLIVFGVVIWLILPANFEQSVSEEKSIQTLDSS